MAVHLLEQEGIFDPILFMTIWNNSNQWPYQWQNEPVDYYHSFDGCVKRLEEQFPNFILQDGGPMLVYHSHPRAIQIRNKLRTNPHICMERVAPAWRKRGYYTTENPFL
jgi:hypothetical protein